MKDNEDQILILTGSLPAQPYQFVDPEIYNPNVKLLKFSVGGTKGIRWESPRLYCGGTLCDNVARYAIVDDGAPRFCGLCDIAHNNGQGFRVNWHR